MRTTLNLPDGLVEEAQQLFGFNSKSETVIFSLKEIIRRARVEGREKLLDTLNIHSEAGKRRRRR